MTRPVAIAALVALPVAVTGQTPPATQPIPTAEIAGRLRAPTRIDPRARRVLERAESAYGKLKAARIVTRGGGLSSTAHFQRPNLLHLVVSKTDGELVSLVVADGRRYYEYTESRRQYAEREASALTKLALPAPVRPIFQPGEPGRTMVGLDAAPVARESSFRYVGEELIKGRKADELAVTVLTRHPTAGWASFESRRFYDRKTGFLVRLVNGARRQDVETTPKPGFPADAFAWRPPPGAVKALR